MHIYKDCSYPSARPYPFKHLENCKPWNRSGLFYPWLADTRAGCDKYAIQKKSKYAQKKQETVLS